MLFKKLLEFVLCIEFFKILMLTEFFYLIEFSFQNITTSAGLLSSVTSGVVEFSDVSAANSPYSVYYINTPDKTWPQRPDSCNSTFSLPLSVSLSENSQKSWFYGERGNPPGNGKPPSWHFSYRGRAVPGKVSPISLNSFPPRLIFYPLFGSRKNAGKVKRVIESTER